MEYKVDWLQALARTVHGYIRVHCAFWRPVILTVTFPPRPKDTIREGSLECDSTVFIREQSCSCRCYYGSAV
jgi:hypothetical protein